MSLLPQRVTTILLYPTALKLGKCRPLQIGPFTDLLTWCPSLWKKHNVLPIFWGSGGALGALEGGGGYIFQYRGGRSNLKGGNDFDSISDTQEDPFLASIPRIK